MNERRIKELLALMNTSRSRCVIRNDWKGKDYYVAYTQDECETVAVMAFRDRRLKKVLGYITASSADDGYVIDEYEFCEEAYEHGVNMQMIRILKDVSCRFEGRFRVSSAMPDEIQAMIKKIIQ